MHRLLSNGLPAVLLVLFAFACSSESDSGGGQPLTDDEYRAQAVQGMHDALLSDVHALATAAQDLRAAAPTPAGRGWDAAQDADAIAAMRDAWVRARTAYEHIEGALAPLFPQIDNAIDARYDDFMTQLAATGGDTYLFDGVGVTGMHAVERILYSDVTPQRVIDFEQTLPGYVAAAFPATPTEATDFKTKLCQKLITDASALENQFTPANLQVAVAFQGLISLMNEQREKVQKASSNEEESRYSQRTMADLRDNLDGTKTVYSFFEPWIQSKHDGAAPAKDGPAIDVAILRGFDTLATAYAEVTGDAVPQPPSTWSAEDPSATDLQTPFGQLYTVVEGAVDPTAPGSIVAEMDDAAVILGFPQFKEGP